LGELLRQDVPQNPSKSQLIGLLQIVEELPFGDFGLLSGELLASFGCPLLESSESCFNIDMDQNHHSL